MNKFTFLSNWFIIISLVIFLIILVLIIWFFQANTITLSPLTNINSINSSQNKSLSENLNTSTEGQTITEEVIVYSPKRQEQVTSPLVIEGQARGMWFFEASFPVVLKDVQGNIIAQGIATALDDWMSEDFVPFRASLVFTSLPQAGAGTLILQKDNPSGLPENDALVEVPVIFASPISL
ncbi:hypothetical protein CO172_01455 [Candidatus Uhrbacteria bacterium CG_4_9_14_3_um_filter_36_7]|uniref:Bacterial spore germination immunoglobulin-like domain-containing protein n=1 Tax=Candidatus Uhrbacteria bacterium CG_4_9_14_3_um_filter_36_7 TaxID=1975033 RepID=A0A2M7XHR5_9BACT|nr:MAG: hypothetical protein CO172_01455 [Candidatus Uhrbacteria bacterium CG_4_9_14_3_um_filter_36_7]